jgi:DNA polymerase-3 subunit alpha
MDIKRVKDIMLSKAARAMINTKIKPIIGIEGYVHNGETLDDKSTKQRFHICLFAKNKVGYENLMYL